METTSHRPYARFENEDPRPILGYIEDSDGPSFKTFRIPLVPNGMGKLVRADEVGKYTISVVEPDEDTRQILHG